MITERIKISNDGTGMNESLAITDSLAASLGLTKKESFHLRLLTEEMFSMVRAIAGDFSAEFWIEENNRDCRLHIESKHLKLDYSKRKELLSVSTKGENIASRGLMEKIREFVEAGMYSIEESFNIQAEYGTGLFSYGAMAPMAMDTGISEAIYLWSMQKYKNEIDSAREGNETPETDDAWDELEKSIIANIADDVRVGVRKGSFEIIVQKKFN